MSFRTKILHRPWCGLECIWNAFSRYVCEESCPEKRVAPSTMFRSGRPSRYMMSMYARSLNRTSSWRIDTRKRRGALYIRWQGSHRDTISFRRSSASMFTASNRHAAEGCLTFCWMMCELSIQILNLLVVKRRVRKTHPRIEVAIEADNGDVRCVGIH